jgi:putative PEP-CTERM system TPR-repeat lipoprotein
MLKRTSRFISIFALIALNVACARETPEELLELTTAAMKAGDLRTASIHVRNLLQQDPANVDARLLLAQISLGLGDPASAEAAARRAIQEGVGGTDSYLILLRALGMQGNYQEVIAQYVVMPESPDPAVQAEALTIVGAARHALGSLAEAEANLRRAVELNPSSLDASTRLAGVLVDAGTRDEALRVISGVLADDPEYVPALALRARVEGMAGLFATAEETLNTALEAQRRLTGSPTNVSVMVQLIDAQVSQNKIDEAAANADALLTAAPMHPLARYSKAAVSFKQGKIEDAEELLTALVAEQPNLWPAVRLLGVIDAQQGQLGQAEAAFQRVLNSNPQDHATRVQLAEVHIRQGDLARARELFEGTPAVQQSDDAFSAIVGAANLQLLGANASNSYLSTLAPTQGMAELLNRVGALVSGGQFDNAVTAIRDAQLQTPEEVLASQYLLTAVHIAARNLDAAREVAERLIQENPQLAWVYTLRAHVALRAAEPNLAREMLDRALAIDGKQVQALLLRAGIDIGADSLQSAEGFLRRVIDVEPTNTQALLGLAQVALGRNDAALARSWIEKAPESIQRTEIIGRLDLAAGNFAQAAAAFARAYDAQPSSERAVQFFQAASRAGQPNPEQYLVAWLRINPMDVTANMLLAGTATAAGDSAEAIDRYERVVNVQPTNAVALNNLAWLYSENGDSRALATAERAHDAAPDNPSILDTLGWLLVQSGDHARAAELLEQAAAAPDSPAEIRYHFGVALAESGQQTRAIEVLGRALADAASFPGREDAEQRLRTLQAAQR